MPGPWYSIFTEIFKFSLLTRIGNIQIYSYLRLISYFLYLSVFLYSIIWLLSFISLSYSTLVFLVGSPLDIFQSLILLLTLPAQSFGGCFPLFTFLPVLQFSNFLFSTFYFQYSVFNHTSVFILLNIYSLSITFYRFIYVHSPLVLFTLFQAWIINRKGITL